MQGTMKRSSTIQAVLQELRRDIVMGNLENDTPVTEMQFSSDYGCSRAALRGALTVLEQEGLIRVMPNGTKRICSLSTEDINHLYELRSYVECTAASQILMKETMDISGLFQVLEQAKKEDDFLNSDALFHEMIVSMSGNKALMQAWKTFVPVTRELFALNFSHAEKMKESLEQRHGQIAKLLLERNDGAVQLLKEHIEEARRLSVNEKENR